MKKLLQGLIAIAAMAVLPAMAADMPVKAPVVAPVTAYNWSGFYIGAHGGWSWGDVEYTFISDAFFNTAPGQTFSHRFEGAMAGGHIGYNWQWGGNWLAGLEVAGTWSNVRRTVGSPFFGVVADPDLFSTEVRWLVTVTPRLGVTAGNALFYVKGGLAGAQVFNRLSVPSNPLNFVERAATRAGWTFGGGAELLVDRSWVFGIEGNYYHLGTLNVNQTTGAFSNHDVDVTLWSVLARLSYKFGAPASVVARY
jgi:outer membrane immunogenic protein